MSRRIVIKGGVNCRLSNLAEEVISEMQSEGIKELSYDAKAGQFVYDGLDDYYKDTVEKAEALYGLKLQMHQIAKVKESAKKRGFKAEEVTTETGKIKLKLTRRIYG